MCASLQEQIDNGFIALASSPADDAATVHVSRSVHIGPCVQKSPDAVDVTIGRGEMQRAGIVSDIARVRVGSASNQQTEGLRMTNREMETCAAFGRPFANEARFDIQHRLQDVDVAGLAGAKKLGERRTSGEIAVRHRLIACTEPYSAKYRPSVACPGLANPFVISDTTIINIPEISVIGTTGSMPNTNVPAAPRVMMR